MEQGKRGLEHGMRQERAGEGERKAIEIPVTVEALEDATSDAFAIVEADLGLWYRKTEATKTGEELAPSFVTTSYESWLQVTALLEDAFFTQGNGALAKQLLELIRLEESSFRESINLQASLAILRETSRAADTMYPILGQLVRLNPGKTREEMTRLIFTNAPEATGIVEIEEEETASYSLPGLLHELGKRVEQMYAAAGKPAPEEVHAWSIEREVKLNPDVRVTNPFSESPENKTFFADRIELAKRAGEEHPNMLSVSKARTERLIAELENMREQLDVKEQPLLRDAYEYLEDWLSAKMVYYSAGNISDVKLYHIGMENPQEQLTLIGVLDEIKRANPELFVELTGTNPRDNGRSTYFGSFLQNALYNTQQAVESAGLEAGKDFRLGLMLKQLLRMDESVDLYDGSVTKDNYKALVEDAMKRVAAEETVEGKAALAQILGMVLVRPAIEAQVNSELEAMREVNIEGFKRELQERLADVAHPALTLEFLGKAPITALRDADVSQELRVIFGKELKNEQELFDFREACAERDISLEKALFDRIPIFDYEKGEWGPFYKALAESTMPPLLNLLADQLTGSEDYTITERVVILMQNRTAVSIKVSQSIPGLSMVERAWLNQAKMPFLTKKNERRYRTRRPDRLPVTERPIDFVDFVITHPNAELREYDKSELREMGVDNIIMAFLCHPDGVKILQKHFDELIELVPEEKREDLVVRLFNWRQYKKHPELLPLALQHPELLAPATAGIDPSNGKPQSMLDSAYSATFDFGISPIISNDAIGVGIEARTILFQNIGRILEAAERAEWKGLQKAMLNDLKHRFENSMGVGRFVQSLMGSSKENLVSYGKYDELVDYFVRILETDIKHDGNDEEFNNILIQELEHFAPSALEATVTYFLKPENWNAEVALALAKKVKIFENIDNVKSGKFWRALTPSFPDAAEEFAKHIPGHSVIREKQEGVPETIIYIKEDE